MTRLAIVCPCYNEEAVLDRSAGVLESLLDGLVAKGKISADSYVLIVNDGSRDKSWEIITRLHREDKRIKGLDLSRNVGHQNAIMAGMMEAADHCGALITMDVDLQDDVNAIEKMVDDFNEGYEVVYGVKVQRDADPVLKRMSATAFYKLQSKLGVETIYNHADFRLLSARVVKELARYGERNLYLRGIIPLLGYKSTTVDDVIGKRMGGQSKYTLHKMLSLALNGVTSFSVKPIYAIMYAGWVFVLISLIIGIYVIVSLLSGSAEHGWASMMLSIWFVGGAILISIGIVGVYIGKIYVEAKRRPLYHVRELLDD